MDAGRLAAGRRADGPGARGLAIHRPVRRANEPTYPIAGRKRPGRRPPNRYRGGGPPVRPDGFQDLGLRHVYDLIIPGIRGGDRRQFFNRAAAGLVVGMGLTVAFIGLGEG